MLTREKTLASFEEHVAEAERLLKYIDTPHHPSYGTRAERVAEAQAHATLALALRPD